MLSHIKAGLYSDITINFNNYSILSHICYLQKISKYFQCVNDNNYTDKTNIKITFNDINDNILNGVLFEHILLSLYEDSIYISNDIHELIEIYRIYDYFVLNTSDKNNKECLHIIITKIIESFKNTEIIDTYKLLFESTDDFEIYFDKNGSIATYNSANNTIKFDTKDGNNSFTNHSDGYHIFNLNNIKKYVQTDYEKKYSIGKSCQYVINASESTVIHGDFPSYNQMLKTHGWSEEIYKYSSNNFYGRILIKHDLEDNTCGEGWKYYLEIRCCKLHYYIRERPFSIIKNNNYKFTFSQTLFLLSKSEEMTVDKDIYDIIIKMSDIDVKNIPNYPEKYIKKFCFEYSQR